MMDPILRLEKERKNLARLEKVQDRFGTIIMQFFYTSRIILFGSYSQIYEELLPLFSYPEQSIKDGLERIISARKRDLEEVEHLMNENSIDLDLDPKRIFLTN